MKTASDILAEFGIRLRAERHGNQKTVCPNCSHLRKHKRDPCLSVLIDGEGVFFNCKNCSWKGGKSYDAQSKGGRMVRGACDRSGNRVSYGDLQREARRHWR
ncbi:hypothetical protein [Nitrobacter sp. Nb-311A]|uniref:hypothetical protein n=1 Tax=Nitrobacter sp. Nb-311A TaxID=314253 RepID=UPI0002D77EAA|nr:hypothetical protein [Nitrobacter sp. Nb-311A]